MGNSCCSSSSPSTNANAGSVHFDSMEEPSSSRKRQSLNQDYAFDQVAQQSAYDYASSSSTQPKSPYDVFINHRGPDVKDTLAQAIHNKLSEMGVKVFLDKEALDRGDSIPMKIQEAMDDACLHVAIFSERYPESPWCLAELSHMLKTGRTIVPVFYHVKPSDLRWADKEKGSYAAPFAQLESTGRYEVEKLREWKNALQTVSYINGYEVKDEDWKPVLEGLPKSVVMAIKEARLAGHTKAPRLEEERPIVPGPSQGKYPDAVGIDKARDHVIGLLELQDQSTRKTVVVYGVGGIGKTTLATAVFNTLNLKGYKRCRVVMEQDCSKHDIKSLQEQILRDLFNKNVELRDCVEGREQLLKAFRRESTQPLFMFIDNALRGSDLQTLLPEDLSCLPVKSRMLITTRKLDETDIVLHPHIKRCAHAVETLPRLEAKKLLLKKVLGSVDASFDTDIDIDGLVECCGGIPLVLEMVGKRLLSDGSKISHWVRFLKGTLEQGEGDLSERVVDCVYNSLEDEYKEAFLDVASFFHDEERDYVAKIVGDVQMKGLEDAALVKTSDGRVTMHDIVRARGKCLSKWNRITDIESLKAVLRDPQKLQQLKGIKIDKCSEIKEIEFPEEHLDLTSQTLRILTVDGGVEVKGRCKRPFESLRLLDLWDLENNTCLSMGLNNLKRLTVCHGNRLSMNDYDCQIAKSLRVLELWKSSTLPDSLGNLSSLEELRLYWCAFDSLPHSLGQLRLLRSLVIGGCDHLITLPESIGQLKSLKVLRLDECGKLEGLPQSVSQLSSLQELDMADCEMLSRLPDKFGELKSLKYLDVNNCSSLENLSEDFGRLTSLAAMDASGCSKLEGKTMDTLVQLKSLMLVDIRISKRLEARWEQIRELHPLLVSVSYDDWHNDDMPWRRQFKKMMSWKVFHSGRRLMQLDDDGGNLIEWKPSSSFVSGQANLGVLFTMCDFCAPSNSQGLQAVRGKCTELLSQEFHVMYVEVVGLGELSQQSEEHIRQALLRLPPGTIAWIFPHNHMSQLFAYFAYKYLIDRSSYYYGDIYGDSDGVEEVTLAMDALNTFLVEVKPRDSQQSVHSVDDSKPFDRLFSPLNDLHKTWLKSWFSPPSSF